MRPPRRRRSSLSVPAIQPRFLEKAAILTCDEVMIDLEDSVPPQLKPEARRLAADALRRLAYPGKVRAVRINPPSGPWGLDDLRALLQGTPPDCVVIPKVEDPDQVAMVDAVLTRLEAEANISTPVGLELQIESARGLARVDAIASRSERAETLILGPIDLAADLGMPALTPGEGGDPILDAAWVHLLLSILVAARSSGLQALDGPYPRLDDAAGISLVSARAAKLGLDGKWAIHPAQLETINQAFTPAPADLERARMILSEFAASQAQGAGAARSGGEMIDEASRRLAERIVARAPAGGD
ncbi:MAG TPA: CoA ester lyase [Candidatus Nitrosotalea sp.]|nr:CoA ester lyase [Candidatus Nitrosotalea sp.]